MTKQFCPECGNPALQRASIQVDSTGQRHYHLTGRYRPQPRVDWIKSMRHLFSLSLCLSFSNHCHCLVVVSIQPIRFVSKVNDVLKIDQQRNLSWNETFSTMIFSLIHRHLLYMISTVEQQHSVSNQRNDSHRDDDDDHDGEEEFLLLLLLLLLLFVCFMFSFRLWLRENENK